ncbi:MBL fold metallo-hydrolase [Kaarinaea lacus]
MRFASLGSGSRGNGTLIEQGKTCVLVDCGFSAREAEKRLQRLGKSASDITAILVTHEHSDHISGVGPLARRYDIPVWATSGTFFIDRQAARENVADRIGEGVEMHTICSHTAITIGDIEVQPFPVPHDAREPSQFVFHDGDKWLGLLTDVGSYTPHIEEQLSGCDALILECNHDRELLDHGEYPPSLKERVGGNLGHLSNRQAADILSRLDTTNLNCIVAAHLSEKHNTPAMAQQALAEALNCETDWISVANQQTGLDWRDV